MGGRKGGRKREGGMIKGERGRRRKRSSRGGKRKRRDITLSYV